MWTWTELKDRYDVVIIGAGAHGLATAYYLARHGITDVALVDKGYLGVGRERPEHGHRPVELPHSRGCALL